MLEQLFKGLFDTELTAVISVADFLLCLGFSLLLGLLLALAYMYRTRYTKSFVVTLALLPAVVCVVIMMVNGNVGAGVAVAGAFSLVRFRSVPPFFLYFIMKKGVGIYVLCNFYFSNTL